MVEPSSHPKRRRSHDSISRSYSALNSVLAAASAMGDRVVHNGHDHEPFMCICTDGRHSSAALEMKEEPGNERAPAKERDPREMKKARHVDGPLGVQSGIHQHAIKQGSLPTSCLLVRKHLKFETLRHLPVSERLHACCGATLGHRTQRGGVTEQFTERHFGSDLP